MTPLHIPEYVLHICDTLRSAGYGAYVVGGGVRDALLGREPKDWDVATDAAPEVVQQLFPKTVATGIEFGTVTVLAGSTPSHAVEVTTFRGESGYADARRPDSVQFIGNIEDDLVRRDFTVNAIAYEPTQGVIVDPHGGQSDLRHKLIRAVGNPNERFFEDGLRVLRAVRIAVELGFAIEPETAAAMRRHGARLLQISRERIGQEWRRMLLAPDAGRGLALLDELSLLSFVLPTAPAKSPAPSAVVRVVAALDRVPDADLVVKTALVLHALGRPEHDQYWLKKLVYPKQAARNVLHVTAFLRSFDADSVESDADLRRFMHRLGKRHVPAFFEAWQAWRPGKAATELKARAEHIVARGDALAANELAVNGHDVQSLLPGTTGPAVGMMLNRLLAHVLEHPKDNTRERLTALLQTWGEQTGIGRTDARPPSIGPGCR